MVTRTTALTWVLGIAVLVSAAGVVYVSANPAPDTDPYSEFYVLGPGGNASDYPTDLTVGEEATVVAGVTNHEYDDVTYTVVAELDGRTVATRSETIADGETWELPVSFTAQSPDAERLQLSLYEGADPDTTAEPDQTLRLLLSVEA